MRSASWRGIFNRNKNFSGVLQAILPAIQEHPNFKRSLPIQGETRFRVALSHKDDPAREMLVTILAFDVPNGDSAEQKDQLR